MENIRTVLEKGTAEIIVPFLVPGMVQTGHGEGEEWLTADNGVAQGSPLRPSLPVQRIHGYFCRSSRRNTERHVQGAMQDVRR